MAHQEKQLAEPLTAQNPDMPEEHQYHSDTVVILGREITVAGGIYTVVFFALGILTIIEVLLAELENEIVIPLMLAIAAAKALLVVLFYMHLRTDSRLFALTLAIPLGIGLLSVMYLMAVPTTYG